jgi:hypothetical protein
MITELSKRPGPEWAGRATEKTIIRAIDKKVKLSL